LGETGCPSSVSGCLGELGGIKRCVPHINRTLRQHFDTSLKALLLEESGRIDVVGNVSIPTTQVVAHHCCPRRTDADQNKGKNKLQKTKK
jgi:hypothetical protein